MIKEEKRKSKYNREKSKSRVLMEYIRTISLSFLAALIITTGLAIHARNEMIKNLYVNIEEKAKMEEQIAKQVVMQSDLMKDLKNQKDSICMHVGYLYETVHDYNNAQIAYELALEKAKPGVYTPYFKLAGVLIAKEDFTEAQRLLNSVKDTKDKKLIKQKTRSYIEMGDKYYSIGKFLSAAKSYERAKFYYDKFSRKDKVIDNAIIVRLVNAYSEAAGILVKSGYNSDAVRFLQKAEKYDPKNLNIQYKLAIIYSDLDPEKSVDYFEPLLDKIPQHIDYGTYCKALMKAANIADLSGRPTQAKYYRYKIHSIDIFIDRKVVYKNDIDVYLDSFVIKKLWFKYQLRPTYTFENISNNDINNLSAEFVLRNRDKVKEVVTQKIVHKSKPLYSNGGKTEKITVMFGKNIFTRKELENYTIDVYLFKDEKYKTLVGSVKIPKKSIYPVKQELEQMIKGF